MDGAKAFKKRKLTDKSIPNAVLHNPDFAEDSEMYQSLLEMERKLDWTMTRKKGEIQDSITRPPSSARTLRIFLSHTVSGQAWQKGSENADALNVESGEGIPAWTFKVEGRLLERGREKSTPRKFSTFIKRMVVDLDRDTSLYPEGNTSEWPRSNHNNPEMDGFTLKRMGDTPTTVRVLITLDHYPEQFKLSPELSDILGIKEESRVGAIHSLWNYIKLQGLQDKVDRRMIRADAKLKHLFGGAENIPFQKLPDIVARNIAPPDPIILTYTIDPNYIPPERPLAWDVEIKAEDSGLKAKMTTLVQANKEGIQKLTKLDEEIALLAQSLHNSHLKRTFLSSFAEDPARFINTWLESQSRDLESIIGSGPTEGMTVRQEELKRSEFFRLPWVEEAVAVQEGYRLATKSH